MLYSATAKIAFAHYPKTAGHSLVAWFREAFPDAAFVEPPVEYTISHLPVRESLERLGLVARRLPAGGDESGGERPHAAAASGSLARRLLAQLPARTAARDDVAGLRILGVVREPFEMLVSLYEYWRTYDFPAPPRPPLIRAAREAPFPVFLGMAVGGHPVQTYRDFFDVGGPAWPATQLVAFESLESGLAAVCREWGLAAPRPLERRNVGPRSGRDLEPYRTAAGFMMDDVRRYFTWYEEEGRRIAVRGE
jgi:hypothetical protein